MRLVYNEPAEVINGVTDHVILAIDEIEDSDRISPDVAHNNHITTPTCAIVHFTSTILGEVLSSPETRMRLALPTEHEVSRSYRPHGIGPTPVSEGRGDGFAGLVHFVSEEPAPNLHAITGYNFSPSGGSLVVERYVGPESAHPSFVQSYLYARVGEPREEDYPEGHPLRGHHYTASRVTLETPTNNLPGNLDSIEPRDLARHAGMIVAQVVTSLASPERRTPEAGRFPNVFADIELRTTFDSRYPTPSE